MNSQTLINALKIVANRYKGSGFQTAMLLEHLANEIDTQERKEAAEEERRHSEIMEAINPHGQG